MTPPQGILEAQAEAMLRRLAREQEIRSRALLDHASEQADDVVSRAWREARTRIREAVAEERKSVEQALAARQAEIESSVLKKEQLAVRHVLDLAWVKLREKLEQRWEQQAARERWCRSACALALDSVLAEYSLVIEFDPDVSSDEGETARAYLSDIGSGQVETRACPGIGPGLRIRAGRACIDATIDGLLAARESVEADLLAEFDRQLGDGGVPQQ